jgi:subtilisin family serine protease
MAADKNFIEARKRSFKACRQFGASGNNSEVDYLYVLGELLVSAGDRDAARRRLRALGAKIQAEEPVGDLPVVRFLLTRDARIPDLVLRLRGDGNQPLVNAAPHFVVAGEPVYQGGPAGFPAPVAPPSPFSGAPDPCVKVAVIDTGYTRGIHPNLDRQCRSTPADGELLDVLIGDGFLDDEAGHGTFIAGVIADRAPLATIELTKALNSAGFGKELDIVNAILLHADAQVINLSLGCYTQSIPPLALTAALDSLPDEVAVVAAAGNNNSDRPMWPAAFERVVSVGAVTPKRQKADFSNFGDWVKACTYGVDIVSSFVDFIEHAPPGSPRPAKRFKAWAKWSGTSFAAPRVAGEIAAMLAGGGFASAREAADSLVNDPVAPHIPGLGTLVVV